MDSAMATANTISRPAKKVAMMRPAATTVDPCPRPNSTRENTAPWNDLNVHEMMKLR